MNVCCAAGPHDIYWLVYNNEYSIMGTRGDGRGEEDWKLMQTRGERGEV